MESEWIGSRAIGLKGLVSRLLKAIAHAEERLLNPIENLKTSLITGRTGNSSTNINVPIVRSIDE